MGEIKWNESQRKAIDFRGKNLLLSAAAGSGKTATLTQRIIELLCDPEADTDIGEMLVLTFTNDAAAELKSRISAALSDAIARDPSDKRLVRQLRNLDSAAISTTHSFLINELRPYFMRFDLPPDFSVCDEAYVAEMKRELMTDTVNDFFDGVCECEDFDLAADTLSGAKDDETLDAALLGLWDDLMRLGLTPSFLSEKRYGGDFLLSPAGKAIADKMRTVSRYYGAVFRFYERELEENEATAKNAPAAAACAEIASELGKVSGAGYLRAKVFLSDYSLPGSKSVKKELATDAYENYKDFKDKFKKELDKLKNKYFSMSEEALRETGERTYRVSKAVSRVLSEFERRFSEGKRERGKIDFNDVERFAAAIFCREDGSPTEEALEVAKKYKYIFIDEYQDTNRLQDMIYTALSHFGSRFMVGDVKQSVYQFRGACPDNFVKYRREYENGGEGEAIFMSENHRSDSGVIDFSNLVSDYMFPFSETPFEADDRLVCAKKNGDGGAPCEVCVVEESPDGELRECDYVAYRISRMIGHDTLRNGELVRPKDIAIIMRTGAMASEYKNALEARGIPVKNSASENFFDHSEVLLLLSLLSAVDNPTSDIYLAATMKSPLFGFTMDDLVVLRGHDRLPLWYSVRRYAEGNDDGLSLRLKDFTEKLNSWREMSRNMLCHKFLGAVITDTGFTSLVDESGNGRLRRSVKKMYSHAIKCAEGGGGLHDLILYLKGLMKGKDSKDAASDGDAVTIITTHRSKGLEYPICFLSDTARQFNMLDSKAPAIIDPQSGFFMKLPDPDGIVRCDTPYRCAAALASVSALKEEEMRVLYVALTRARERLIVTMRTRDGAKAMEDSRKRVELGANAYNVLGVDSAAAWLLDCATLNMGKTCFVLNRVKAEDVACAEAAETERELSAEKTGELEKMLRSKFTFEYPRAHLAGIPAKLSASKLSSDVLDGVAVADSDIPPAPAFLSGERKATAADRGTATHLFLQFCDFSALLSDAEKEAERLLSLGYISAETKDIIRMDEVEAFAKSRLCARILRAKEMYREVRFNHMLPAADFTENAELKAKLSADKTEICVQGVVDCLFTDENGKTVLVDYKTDRLSEEELADRSLAEKKLISRHRDQLMTYSRLCSDMLGQPIDEILIFSLALGDTIRLT